ncbi:hypothetical protein EON66_02445, partial [archaeon]
MRTKEWGSALHACRTLRACTITREKLQIKRLVALPSALSDLHNSPEFFSQMITANAASVMRAYHLAEILFVRLNKIKDRVRPLLALGWV